MKWTRDKLELIKVHLAQGCNLKEIAKNTNMSYDAIKHAVVRYNLREGLNTSKLFQKERGKLKKDDISKLAKLIGENIYDNYKVVKLPEPKPVKCKGKREEMSVLDLSDMHIGMDNKVFDSNIGKKITTYNSSL